MNIEQVLKHSCSKRIDCWIFLNKSLLRLVQYPCEDDLVEMNSMIKFNNQFVLNKSLLRLVQYPCEDDLVEMNSMIKFNNQFDHRIHFNQIILTWILNKSKQTLVQNESIVEFFWTRVCLDLFNIYVRMIWLKWIRWSNSTINSFWTRVCLDLFNIHVRMIWLKWIRWSNSTINSIIEFISTKSSSHRYWTSLSKLLFKTNRLLNFFEQEFDETCSISMWGWFGWNEFDDQIQQSIRIIEFISTKSSSHEYWTSLTKLLFKTNWLLNLFWTRVCLDLFNIHVRMIWLKWIRWSNSTINSIIEFISTKSSSHGYWTSLSKLLFKTNRLLNFFEQEFA